jgi:putative peptide zinc metalloprotease protein
MNLAEALSTSLAELPPLTKAPRFPRLHPGVIAREHKDPDGSYMLAMGADKRSKILYLTMEQWHLLSLCDGTRTCEEVARILNAQGIGATGEGIETIVEDLDKFGFFYKTPQEESITLAAKLAEERRNSSRKKKGAIDLYMIDVVTWDPDRWMGKMLSWVPWIYTPWFTALTVCAFLFMGYTWLANWQLFWNDSLSYWNFTQKGLLDIVQFYFLFGIIAFIHECGHGLTAKHFGAEVHRIGFLLIYTTPAAFVDSGQVWLYHGRRERCITIMAGLWVEMMVCAIATAVWWGTAPGSATHDFAYKVVLIGGILPLIINLNPLMRLDGYLFLSEMTRTPALKEKSVGFLSAWVRRNIFRLPVVVPFYPRRRQIWYAIYAAASGLYSYLVLLFLARITYAVFRNFTPEWAFVPATIVAALIFKSRVLKLLDFLHTLYLDKRELMFAHRKPLLAAAASLLIFLSLPLWHERESADFVLEPVQRAVIRTATPGRVTQVLGSEGQSVRQGTPLLTLTNLRLQSESASSRANLRMASSAAVRAQLDYGNLGAAVAERRSAQTQARLIAEKSRTMTLVSPISGVLVTPRMRDWKDAYLAEGTQVAEVEDTSRLRARLFVPEADMRVLAHATSVALKLPSQVTPVDGRVVKVFPTDQEVAAGLASATEIRGFAGSTHYVAIVEVDNDGHLKPGMSGTAKIFGRRRSVIGLVLQPVFDFVGRKFW